MSRKLPIKLFVNKVLNRIKSSELQFTIELLLSMSCENAIVSIYQDRYEKNNANDVLREVKKNEFNKVKKRWTSNTLKDYKENKQKKTLSKLNLEATLIIEHFNNLSNAEFHKTYNGATADEVIETIISKIEEWNSDDDSLLMEFRYFNSLNTNQKKQAIYKDLTYLIGRVIKEEFKGDLANEIVETTMTELANSFFSNRRGNITVDPPTQFIENEPYSTHENEENTLLIKGQYAISQNLRVHLPDSLDKQIIECILTQRQEQFAIERIIIVDIGKIVRTIFNDQSSKSYKIVRERILHLPEYGILSKIEDKKMNIHFIDGVTFLEENLVRVSISYEIHRDIVNQQFIRTYRSELDKIKNPTAYMLTSALQKERVVFFRENIQKDSFTIHLNYKTFKNYIRFKTNKKNQNLKDVQDGLDVLLENNFLVQSYKRTGETFAITLLPLENYEIQDLLESEITIFNDDSINPLNVLEPMLLN